MASNSYFLAPLALLFILSAILAKGDDTLITKTCKNVTYSDLCISTLKSDPSSAKADVKGLASIMVRFGHAKASSIRSYLKALVYNKATKGALKETLQFCLTRFSYSVRELRVALHKLSKDQFEFAQYDVTSGDDAPDDCKEEFSNTPSLSYPPELSRRGDDFEKICFIAQEIIDPLIPNNS
ncbi:hypothetical protein Nepgr_017655 [Nepenthes gracilis]|uniref:Pectinesterase inhibitor domain-containing protein n=1 Tax=Nepenthes gracilis TaxID=150966 RepID=A0AAD3SRZ4_NEPGR|nr:hypothetical protein Nepgr_017655 [Nepenthes gracilis]